jgi:hypothetical protein
MKGRAGEALRVASRMENGASSINLTASLSSER